MFVVKQQVGPQLCTAVAAHAAGLILTSLSRQEWDASKNVGRMLLIVLIDLNFNALKPCLGSCIDTHTIGLCTDTQRKGYMGWVSGSGDSFMPPRP